MTPYELWQANLEHPVDAPFPREMMPCIEKFFRDVHPRLRPGQGVYDEVFATELMFPLQRKRELAAMLAAAGEPRTVMEIGADKGGGLYHWCMLPSVRNVIACEIRGTPYAHLFEEAFPHIRFHWLQSSSYSKTNVDRVSEQLLKWSGEGPTRYIDVLFIDGDKLGMLKDFDAYLPFVRKPGGVVFLHDVTDTGGPKEAFATLSKSYRTELIHNTSEYTKLATLVAVDAADDRTPWQDWLLHWKGRSCGVGVVYVD